MQRRPVTQHLVLLGLAVLWASSVRLGAQARMMDFSDMTRREKIWVDSVFQLLTEEERIGQLFMLRAHSNKGAQHVADLESAIKKYKIGGLCFFQGTPEKQVEIINELQSATGNVPLLIAMDAEWGLGMRMSGSTISYPRQLMLGAIRNNRLLYEMGEEVARQLKRVGVHINFAPVADINNNAANPVIHERSFGEDRYNVLVKSYMYALGMHDSGVMACAKHFPGHGDTDVDSHYGLPVIGHSPDRLDSIELYPFAGLAKGGIGSMMVGHLNIPALDERENRPTTLSRATVTDILREQMGYEGLIFTDAMEMQGVTAYFDPGEAEAEALAAGNDILLLPADIGQAVRAVQRYLDEGKIDRAQVHRSVKRVLQAKYRLGLTRFRSLREENVRQDINTPDAKALRTRLIKAALTLVRNEKGIVPFRRLDTLSFASLAIGRTARTSFQDRLSSYADFDHFNSGSRLSGLRRSSLLNTLGRKDLVVVGLHNLSDRSEVDFGISDSTLEFLYDLSERTQVILTVFGTPYSLKFFDGIGHVLQAYEDADDVQDLAAQALFGAFGLSGKLPVTASLRSSFNMGERTSALGRLGYGAPEMQGMDSRVLQGIDRIAQNAIDSQATPGIVVLAAKSGQVVWHKAYGYYTYACKQPVQPDDLFDLASVTKIAATTLAVMKLQEDGRMRVDRPLQEALPAAAGSDKGPLIVADIMAHHAGLKSWIPFYKQTLNASRRNPRPSNRYYRLRPEGTYRVAVTEQLYMDEAFVDNIWQQIFESPLRPVPKYIYSDLGFYMLAEAVAERSGWPLDEFVSQVFYRPMGLTELTFNPRRYFNLDRIVPTEEDRYWRRQRVHGYVHDMGAAMLGGVSGHAGLFGSATDLAALMQMLLNGGAYGGQQFLQPSTIGAFTQRHPQSSRRGIGFDMQELNPDASQNMSELASHRTYGHLGFTGTCVWVDPDSELIYIFLSNRTYPSMNNYLLNKLDTRPRIQRVLYEAMQTAPARPAFRAEWQSDRTNLPEE